MAQARLHDNVVPLTDQDDAEVEGTFWPLIEPGEYVARFLYHETARMFVSKRHPEGTCKVFLIFELTEPPYAGLKLYRAYRASSLIGRPGRHGRFRLKKGSDLVRTIHLVFGQQRRLDRISLRPLKNLLLRVKVRTVVRDHAQRELPPSLHYSVVDDIVAVEAGVAHA